jgi:hypothetical protein
LVVGEGQVDAAVGGPEGEDGGIGAGEVAGTVAAALTGAFRFAVVYDIG